MHLIHAYNKFSKSARALADKMKLPLDGEIIELVKGSEGTKVINWGHGDFLIPGIEKLSILNKPEAIRIAVNKLHSFKKLAEANVSIPRWSIDRIYAQAWLQLGHTIIARTRLDGRDGEGIIVVKPGDDVPVAKLYTVFIPNCTEYRVNVFKDRTVGVQKKVPVPGKEHNHMIKTTGGGYGFHLLSADDVPNGIRPVARAAVAALGLDFGGVDLIKDAQGNVYVLEVNTAPELTPSMVDGYAAKFQAWLSS